MTRYTLYLLLAMPTLSPPAVATLRAPEPAPAAVDTDPAAEHAGLPDLPPAHLAPTGDGQTDAARLEAVRHRIAELLERAAAESERAQRSRLLLAAVNQALAYQLEPACSRKLLGLPPDDSLEEARLGLASADEMLATVGEMLEQAHTADPDPPGWVGEIQSRYDLLRAFSLALRAYLLLGPGDEELSRRAASALSPLLENPEPAVAEAAMLWQAALRMRDDEPARTLAVLPRTLVDPPEAGRDYALLARLLRCRVLRQQKAYPAALSLLMQFEERCNRWLRNDADRRPAIQAGRWLRLEILRDWYQDLDPHEAADEREWCAEQMRDLIDRHFEDPQQPGLLRLATAIPVIAQPTPPATPPAGDNGNADTPPPPE